MRTLILVAFILTNLLAFTRCFRTVCFYYSILPYKSGVGMLEPDNLFPTLCTHWVYSHAIVSGLQVKPAYATDEGIWWSYGTYKRFLSHRQENPSLKFLLALGRVNGGPESLTHVMKTRATQNSFAIKLAAFTRERKFDGVLLEWSNLAAQVNTSYDKRELLNLVEVIRAAFNVSAGTNGSLILAVSLPAIKEQVDRGFLVNNIARVVDFITIRTLDMRTATDKRVGLSSPLFSNSQAVGDDRFLSVDAIVTYYQSTGVPAEKINFAIPTYARTFTLASAEKSDIGAAAIGPGEAGETTAIYGILAYYEFCRLIRFGGKIYDVPSQQGRYYVVDNMWMSYEDIYSVIQKVCYVKQKGIGGLSFYSLEVDDFIAGCGRGMHPLITTAMNTLINDDLSQCTPDRYEFVDVPTPPGAATTPIPEDTPKPLEKRVVCYFTNVGFYRRGKGQFLPESINPHICTHIVYNNAVFKNNTLSSSFHQEETQNWYRGLYLRVMDARIYNPNLKVILGIGGSAAGPSGFEYVSRNNDSRAIFAVQTVRFLRERKFDGFEIDWQFVSSNYKINNRLLIQALRTSFDQEANATGKPRLLLSTTLPSRQDRIDAGFKGELPTIAKFVDFFSVLTYDFHGDWNSYTAHHSAMYTSAEDHGDVRQYNLDWVITYYVSLGVPKLQINVGISTIGAAWTLKDAKYNFLYADASFGKPLAYYEVCELIASGAKKVHDGEARVNYAFLDRNWVGYDDVETVTEKACYTLQGGFGGVMIRSLDNDDFKGESCGEGKYPLTTAAFNIMRSQDMKLCARFVFTKSTSGVYQHLRGSLLLYLSLLLLWPVAGFSLE